MKNVIRLSDKELELIKEIEEITAVDYEIEGNTIEPINLLTALEDMKFEYTYLQDEFEKYRHEKEDINFYQLMEE